MRRMTKKKGIARGKRIAAGLTALLMVGGILTGCAGSEGELKGTADGAQENSATGMSGGKESSAGNGMGRYVDQEVALNDNSLEDWNSRIFMMEDGSLLLAVNGGYTLRSYDKGGSWIREEQPWLSRIAEEHNYIMSLAFGADQTAAVIYCPPDEQDESESEEDSADGGQTKLNTKLLLIQSDGTEIPVDMKLTEEEMWLTGVFISDTGRIVVSTMDSTLYEVNMDGSCEEFLRVEEGTPQLIRFHGNYMLVDGYGYRAPLIYDMETGDYVEDDVLADCVEENYGDRDGYMGRNHDMFLFSGGDDAIYIAGQKGLYRHVLGGSAIEQIVDGNLSILGNPAYSIMDMVMIDDNEFMAILSGGKVVRFVYDPDIPTIPDSILKVYSLEERTTIRQAINLYQAANPAVYVDYEVGRQQDYSITREDALKNLNTRMMAGEGPDILILDNMPVDSYMEKGLLMDIAPVIEGMSGDAAIFPNVVDAFREDGHIYMMPCEIQLPYVLGRTEDLDKMTDVSSLGNVMQDLRADNPGADLLRICSAKAIMRILAISSAPEWRTQTGELNKEAVTEFLETSKQIYDAQMSGLSEDALDEWEIWSRYYEENYGIALEDSDDIRLNEDEIYFKADMCKLLISALKDIDEYTLQTSLALSEECKSVPMAGADGSVFWARTLMGINASSANADLARTFLQTVFSADVQGRVLGGVPVNKKVILDYYADQRRRYEGNNYISGSISLGSVERVVCEIVIHVPDETQVDGLIEWIEQADVVYLEDAAFENVVYEEGVSYIREDSSLEEAVDAIEQRLRIYLAE